MYLYNYQNWPIFEWNSEKLLPLLSYVRNRQGKLIGKMGALGFELRNEANLEILTQEIIKSTEIEGEILDREQVRSSIARRLGLDISGLVYSERNVDGIVDLMIDATKNFDKELNKERLFLGMQHFSQLDKVECIKSLQDIGVTIQQDQCWLFQVHWEKKKFITKHHQRRKLKMKCGFSWIGLIWSKILTWY